MRGRRVGLLCGYLDPAQDGVADYTRRLAVELRAVGYEPLLLTTYQCAHAAGEGAVGVSERWNVRGVAAAARAVRRLDLDLLHVQFAPSAFGASRAVGLLPLFLPRDTALIVTLHEYGEWSGRGLGRRIRSALWSWAERSRYVDRETFLLVPRAARLLVPSPEHLAVLRHRYPRDAPAALEIPIGVNVDLEIGGPGPARAEVRRELGVAPDVPLVAFFGFLHPEKALDSLIAAVAAVREQHPGVQLLLIGGGESHSVSGAAANRLRQELESVAAACGIQDHVHFTGYLRDAEVSRLLHAADVAAFPFNAGVTRKSSSLLTALAAGVSVVATSPPGEVTGPTERDGVLRVPPRDTAALADALGTVLSHHTLAARLRATGRALAASHSWDAIASAHAEVYARTLASSAAPDRGQKKKNRAG